MIKSFFEKMNEASLKGNVGIPGEGDKGGRKYLSDVEARAAQRNRDLELRHGRDIPRFMSLVSRARQIQAGHEKELERLAEKSIRALYSSILDGVELVIKFPEQNQIQKMMKNVKEKPEPAEMPVMKKLEDNDIISKIQVRKIANNITQGEAKNVKKVLVMPETLEEFIKILGEEEGREYKDTLIKISDIAGYFDWRMPMEVQLEMWTRDKSGFSGSVNVSWETPKEDEEEESAEDLAKRILDDLQSDEDLPEEETKQLFDQVTPTITALGTDFSMLIHETVKGIYDLISANAIPQDQEEAETVIMNTDTLADEIEDLRYGPEIAADLRDFLNQFRETGEIENLREHFFGKMMIMEPKEMLDLMFLILNQDPKAKKLAQEIIDEIKKELSDYELQMAGIETDEEPEYSGEPEEESPEEIDYSTLSQREIQSMIDKALDDGDYDRVRELSQYLKESKRHDIFEKLHSIEGYPSNKKKK